MITQTITPLPPNPDPATDTPVVFSSKAAASVLAQKAMVPEMNTAIAQINSTASDINTSVSAAASAATAAAASAMDAASSAIAAANSANAVKWVSATTYADGDVVWSPGSSGRFNYRRIGAGAGTTDPSIDPTHWALQLYPLGLGGAAVTGNVSLTSTSAAAIKLAPTGPGLYAQLPVATTCVKAALQFVFDNSAGEYYYGIKDGAGNVLGWVRPGATAVIGLSDNTTSAGVWTMTGISKIGVTASLDVPSWVDGAQDIQRVAIDANRTLLLVQLQTGPAVYAVAYDASTQTWGAPIFVRNVTVSAVRGVLSAANQVMVVTTSSTTLQAVTISMSGVALTLNSPVSATTSSNITSFGDLKAVGASWVIPYVLTTSQATGARAISVSGTVPAIGTESALGGTAVPPLVFVTGSVARLVSASTTTLYCQPYTVSGSTLTHGTDASVAATAPDYRAFMNGNGNIVTFYANTTQYGAIFKLTSTTEAVTSVNLNASTAASSSLDYVEMSASKTAYLMPASFSAVAGTVTDTAGSISTGSTVMLNNINGTMVALGYSGSLVRFATVQSGVGLTTQAQFDCSGTTPVLAASQTSPLATGSLQSRGRSGARGWAQLTAGTTSYSLTNNGNPIAAYMPSSLRSLSPLDATISIGAPGAANETWAVASMAVGASIKRIEAAA